MTFETEQDLNEGFKMLQNKGHNYPMQHGKVEALKDKASILDLSKMLIQRTDNKARGKA